MLHAFDTQTNEVLNTLITKSTLKGNQYISTLLLTNRVLIDASIKSIGHKTLWCTLYKEIGINIIISLKTYLATKDRCQTLSSVQK